MENKISDADFLQHLDASWSENWWPKATAERLLEIARKAVRYEAALRKISDLTTNGSIVSGGIAQLALDGQNKPSPPKEPK